MSLYLIARQKYIMHRLISGKLDKCLCSPLDNELIHGHKWMSKSSNLDFKECFCQQEFQVRSEIDKAKLNTYSLTSTMLNEYDILKQKQATLRPATGETSHLAVSNCISEVYPAIVIRILIVRNDIFLKYPRFAYALKIQLLVLWILVWGLSVLSSSTTLFLISSSTSDVLSARLFYFGLRLHGFEIKYQVLNKVACVWCAFLCW